MFAAFRSKLGMFSSVGVAVVAQAAGCDCDFGNLFPKGTDVTIDGPATVKVGQVATFAIVNQGLGTATCPKQVTFSFRSSGKANPPVNVPNPATKVVDGKCIVTRASASTTFGSDGAPGTRSAKVGVELVGDDLSRSEGVKAFDVSEPAGGASPTPTATATATPAGPSAFFVPDTFAVGANPVGVDAGDYNGAAAGGTGIAVASDAGSSAQASVVVATGSSFRTFDAYDLGVNYQPTDITGADFNGDGVRDLAVSGSNTGSNVSVLDGSASGTFGAPHKPAGDFGQPYGVTTGDINGDGKPDVVATGTNSGTAVVALNTTASAGAASTFGAALTFPAGPGGSFFPFAVAAGDLDADGKVDLVLASQEGNGHVTLLRNTTTDAATPTFAAPQALTTDVGRRARDVTIADFTGDGKPDIAVANSGLNTVSLFPNAGGFTFGAEKTFGVGGGPVALAPLDATGDGKLDLAVAEYGFNTASFLANDGAGGFKPHESFDTGESPEGVAAGRLNADTRDDFAVANNGEPAPGNRAGGITVVTTKPAGRSAGLDAASAKAAPKSVQTAGSLTLRKGTKLGKTTFDADGTIHVKNATVVARMALKVLGKRLKGEPKGLRKLLSADLRGSLSFDRYIVPTGGDRVLARGTLAGRSRKSRRLTACVKLGPATTAAGPVQRLSLLGATGKAARLRLTADIAPISLSASPTATGSDKPLVTVSTGKKRKLSKTCRALVRKLPKK